MQGGKYKIERMLGQGGFGITYLATLYIETDQSLGRIRTTASVTIKEFFMQEHCSRNNATSRVSVSSPGAVEMVERFKRKFVKEAQTLASLDYPHIVKIYDVFEENGTAYYVMEYIDGGTLRERIDKQGGALAESDAIRYVRQIANALGYMHGKQMNHLDVKPGNIMLNAADNAVLIDFGLTKHYDDEGRATSTTPVGISRGYAPIEQYNSGGVNTFSPAADIYSLGATLYTLVVGVRPPEATDVLTSGLPPLPSNISESTVRAIRAAMQSIPQNRPQSIGEFLSLLGYRYESTEIAAEVDNEKTTCDLSDNSDHDTTPVPEQNPNELSVAEQIVIGVILSVLVLCIIIMILSYYHII